MSAPSSPDPRRPLDAREVREELDRTGAALADVRLVGVTGSTNADAEELVRAGVEPPFAVLADEQVEGRGRLGRTWVAPLGTSVLMSLVLRPSVPVRRWTWLPLLAGVAACDAIAERTGAQAAVKWPNDVLLDGAKVAGVLSERMPSGVAIIGMGINVDQGEDELPEGGGSLRTGTGTRVDRAGLAALVLRHLLDRVSRWEAADGDPAALALDYEARSATIGRPVRAALPSGEDIEGVATGIDGDGALQVRTADGLRTVSAGDIASLRSR